MYFTVDRCANPIRAGADSKCRAGADSNDRGGHFNAIKIDFNSGDKKDTNSSALVRKRSGRMRTSSPHAVEQCVFACCSVQLKWNGAVSGFLSF